MTLNEYFINWDPMGFIEDLGAPRDEYSYEVAQIKVGFKSDMSATDVANLIYKVFDEHIGVGESPNFKEECNQKADDIKEILLNR